MTPQSNRDGVSAPWLQGLVEQATAGKVGVTPRPSPPTGGWRRWFDYDHCIWLVFLGFWFLEPYLDHQPLRHIGSVLFAGGRSLPPALCVGAFRPPQDSPVLGARYVHPGHGVCARSTRVAWGIFIYIAASLPEVSESTNTVIGLLLLQCASIVTQSWLLHLQAWTWSMGVGFTLLIGMNRLRMKQKETRRRQAAIGS